MEFHRGKRKVDKNERKNRAPRFQQLVKESVFIIEGKLVSNLEIVENHPFGFCIPFHYESLVLSREM